jgi:hypothetical protein
MKPRIFFVALWSVFVLFGGCSGEQNEKTKEVKSVSVANQLALIPTDTNILFYINLENLKKSPLGEELSIELEQSIKENGEDQDYLEFVEETGLDLKRDVYEIWLAVAAHKDDEEAGGLIVRGKFDRDNIIEYLKREKPHEVEEQKYKDFEFYVFDHKDDTGMVFLNNETLVLGKSYWLRKVIDQSTNGESSILDNLVMTELMDKIPNREQFWGIMNLKGLVEKWANEIRKRGSGFKGTQSLENMEWIILHTEIDQKAKVVLEGNFSTDEEARLLSDMLNGFKAMAKLSVSDDKEVVDMLNKIKITSDGSVLSITAKIDRDFVEKMQKKRKEFGENKFKWM